MSSVRAPIVMTVLAVFATSAFAKTKTAIDMTQPPDPRLGEELDGRPTPVDPFRRPRALGRAALLPARWLLLGLGKPTAYIASFVERHHLIERTYWGVTSDDRLIGLRPEAQYETGYTFSVGARLFDKRSLGPGSLVNLRVRSGGLRFDFLEMRIRAPHTSPLAAEMHVLYDRNPAGIFGGTDGESRAELAAEGRGVAHFAVARALSGLEVARWLGGPFAIWARGEFDLRSFHDEGGDQGITTLWCAQPGTASCRDVDDKLVPGFHDGQRLFRTRLGMVVDTRDPAQRAGGFRLSGDAALAHGIADDPTFDLSLYADARAAIGLHDRSLIFRVAAGAVRSLDSAPVPFEELVQPGGNFGLRGLSAGRLRGESELLGSIEYRWLLAPYLDAALFVDEGGAFGRNFDGLSLHHMIPSFGGGVRVHAIRPDYWRAEGVASVQLAHAPDEGFRLIIIIGEAVLPGDPFHW
jgi:hypothetical protein